MDFHKREHSISELIEAYNSGSLARNPEYQRGAAWKIGQKQGLIDSVFRRYPLPALFLEVKKKTGLGNVPQEFFEIIDGQQRILTLAEFFKDDYATLLPDDPKLRLPLSLRSANAPWAGKRFSELSSDLQDHIRSYLIPAYIVEDVSNSDEVRDLFIRLQSGTALTRQQIRDAWPGQLGPKIEVWAGKLSRKPKYSFFDSVDGRGTRDDEDDANDPYVKQRTTCAQLCALLLERQGNPWSFPSIKAADIDSLYHRYTLLEQGTEVFTSLEKVFDDLEDVALRIQRKSTGRKKINKKSLFSLAMFLQDMRRSPLYKASSSTKEELADHAISPGVEASRGISGGVIREYYEKWRANMPLSSIGIHLDSKRLFDEADKRIIWERSGGICQVCGKSLSEEDVEYDHFPVPHRDGGRTLPENGRAVHSKCHPRGRPPLDE